MEASEPVDVTCCAICDRETIQTNLPLTPVAGHLQHASCVHRRLEGSVDFSGRQVVEEEVVHAAALRRGLYRKNGSADTIRYQLSTGTVPVVKKAWYISMKLKVAML